MSKARVHKLYRISKAGEALGCALLFLASKGLLDEFTEFLKKFRELPLEEREPFLKEKLKDLKSSIIEGS